MADFWGNPEDSLRRHRKMRKGLSNPPGWVHSGYSPGRKPCAESYELPDPTAFDSVLFLPVKAGFFLPTSVPCYHRPQFTMWKNLQLPFRHKTSIMYCKGWLGMQRIQQWMFHTLLKRIQKADDKEMNEIIYSILKRYRTVYPDWDVAFLFLPKDDPKKRAALLNAILDSLREHP